jgi:5-methylcytosine-specific restriction protein B
MTATLKMLYGPPGTGKTWLAAREAVKAVDPAAFAVAYQAGNDKELQRLHRAYVDEGRILWVTFHPNYSYEDFVEGYRPVVKNGTMVYEPVDGPFKRLCERAARKSDLALGDLLNDKNGRPIYSVVGVNDGGWTVRSSTNRSDRVAASTDKYVPRDLVEKLLAGGFSPDIFSLAGTSLYDPAELGVDRADPDLPPPGEGEKLHQRLGSVLKRVIASKTGVLSSTDFSNSSHTAAVMRTLTAIRSGDAVEVPVAMVIDEFNRADPSRVFGELLTLLELDKRRGLPEERRVWLPYSKSTFSIPPSVSVIATMNTVDKSLATVDYAMRRRFRFQYVGPELELLPGAGATSPLGEHYGGIDLRAFLKRVNVRLSALLGTGHEIGHASLLPAKLLEVGAMLGGPDDEDRKLRSVAYVIRTGILPTIAEYFHDDWRKVNAVIGEVIVEGNDVSLIESPALDNAFVGRLPDDYELADGRVAYFSDWWNPEASVWDRNRFRTFVVALANGH